MNGWWASWQRPLREWAGSTGRYAPALVWPRPWSSLSTVGHVNKAYSLSHQFELLLFGGGKIT